MQAAPPLFFPAIEIPPHPIRIFYNPVLKKQGDVKESNNCYFLLPE